MHHEEDPWLWKPLKTAYRYESPDFWDAVAHFNAAARFMDGVETMLENQDHAEDGEQTIAIAAAAAVAYNYVRRTWAQNMIIDCLAEDEYAELAEGDDPEALQAANAGFQRTEERLKALTKRREQALADNPVKAKPMQIARHGNNAAAAGNAAALRYHAGRIADESLSLKERQGHMVASWVNHENLLHFLRYRTRESETALLAEDAMEHLWAACMEMEQHRPRNVTGAAWNLGEDLVEEADGQLMQNQDWDISYLVDDASTSRWLMAYHYQGAVYVKTVEEPYRHPVDQDTALEHANQLMTVVDEDAHHLTDDPEEVEDIRRALILQHCAAAQMAEAQLQSMHEDHTKSLLEMVWDYTKDHGALRATAEAVTRNQPMATERVLSTFNVPAPLMTWEQADEAVNAARRAGADENSLREMCRRLGTNPLSHGISPKTKPHRRRLHSLESIIESVCEMRYNPRQTAMKVVRALGEDPESEKVQETITRCEEYQAD